METVAYRDFGTLTLEEATERFHILIAYHNALYEFMYVEPGLTDVQRARLEDEFQTNGRVVNRYANMLKRYERLYDTLKSLTINQLINDY